MRKRSEPPTSAPTDHRAPSAQETTWLSRAMVVGGLYLVLIWVAEGTDLFSLDPKREIPPWMFSLLPAEILLAGVAVFGAHHLRRPSGRRDVFALVTAGGLLFLSVERLALLVSAGMNHALVPGERLQIAAAGICLGLAVWTVSHSLRLRADR